MNPWQKMVREFHDKLALPSGDTPTLIAHKRLLIRDQWTCDELEEMESASRDGDDIEGVADGIVDAIYFLVGTAVEMGIDLDPLFAAVHAANMQKTGGGTRADGKVLKPENWAAPCLLPLLKAQGWNQ